MLIYMIYKTVVILSAVLKLIYILVICSLMDVAWVNLF